MIRDAVAVNHQDMGRSKMITLSEDPWKNELAVRRMVSIELQFFAWMRLVEDRKIARCIDLKRGGYQLYMRRSTCFSLPGIGRRVTTLDIASVSLTPKLRGKGWFGCFLELVDHLVPWDAIYVEAVRNPRLGPYLLSVGFIEYGDCSYYRPTRAWRERHGWSEQARADAEALALASKPISLLESLDLLDLVPLKPGGIEHSTPQA